VPKGIVKACDQDGYHVFTLEATRNGGIIEFSGTKTDKKYKVKVINSETLEIGRNWECIIS